MRPEWHEIEDPSELEAVQVRGPLYGLIVGRSVAIHPPVRHACRGSI